MTMKLNGIDAEVIAQDGYVWLRSGERSIEIKSLLAGVSGSTLREKIGNLSGELGELLQMDLNTEPAA